MKKVFYNESNKLRKEIYVLMLSVTLFIGAIVFTENYISAEQPQKYEKPTEAEIKQLFDSAVEAGKLTKEEADEKLQSILSGEMKKKRFGMYGKKPTESQIKERLDRAVEAGKLTQEEADIKLEAILSGDINRKKPGKYTKTEIIL